MRLAIITDIHEDIDNLKRIMRKIDKKGCDKLVCLGDISGYSLPFYKYGKTRSATECLSLVRERCQIIIPGNHDLHAARRIPGHSKVFDFPHNWYDLDLEHRRELAADELWLHEDDMDHGFSSEDLHFLYGLPEYEILETANVNILLSHYASPNLSGFRKKFYTWAREFSGHFNLMEKHNCQLSFIGHAHPRGFFEVTENRFRHMAYRKRKMTKFPAIIGCPPVTRHQYRSGFCIFDSDPLVIKAYR
ncbi:MAG: metallophosphoesterase family protein [Bacteroidales bacterium]